MCCRHAAARSRLVGIEPRGANGDTGIGQGLRCARLSKCTDRTMLPKPASRSQVPRPCSVFSRCRQSGFPDGRRKPERGGWGVYVMGATSLLAVDQTCTSSLCTSQDGAMGLGRGSVSWWSGQECRAIAESQRSGPVRNDAAQRPALAVLRALRVLRIRGP